MRKIEETIKGLVNSFEFDYEKEENITIRDKIKYSLDKVEYFYGIVGFYGK